MKSEKDYSSAGNPAGVPADVAAELAKAKRVGGAMAAGIIKAVHGSPAKCDVCDCSIPDEDDAVRLHDDERDEYQWLCEPCYDRHMADGRVLAAQEGREREWRKREQEAEDRECAAEEERDRRRDEGYGL